LFGLLFKDCFSLTKSGVVAIIIAVRIVASATYPSPPVASSAPFHVPLFGPACIYRTGHFTAVAVG
jgi:hypothetical protein